jgi:hypothetical protein
MEKQYTYDEDIVSDLYKEAFGFRPREDFWANWNSYSDEERQVSWNQMIEFAESEADREHLERLAAEQDLETRIIPNIQSYLNSCIREDAIQHLHKTYETYGSIEYLEHCLGIRYGYLSGSLKVGY